MIHLFVEVLDRYFGNVCELDIIFNFHKAYYILDELFIAGELEESSKKRSVLIDLCQAMAKDKASTRKPRRRNARARDDGGTRRDGSDAARSLDAIASIFVNYHEEREALVEKTEAADLIEQNVAELMQLCYRGASAGRFEFSRPAPRSSLARRARPTIASARASPVAARAARRVLPLERTRRRRRRGAAALTSPEAAGPLEAAPPAPAPRRRAAASKRVVDDADADDEDEAWEPGRPSNMDLDDDEQEQAAKAKRKLKRRSKKKSAKAKNAAGAAPHAPVSAPPRPRRRAARASTTIAPRRRSRRLQRLFPNLDFRLSWSVRFNVVVQTIDAIALDSNLELTRVDMEVRRSTVGVYEDSLACQLLGQTYYVHPDKTIKITVDLVVTSEVIGVPRTAPGRAEVHIKELGFHFIDPLAPIAEKEIVPRVRVFIPYLGIEGWISITLDDGHLIVELKYLQAMHVKNRMLKKCCYTLYLLELADRLRGEASRETLKTARKNVVEFDMVVLARPTLMRVIRKFANAIARKAAEARGETFVPTPYDETAVDAVVVSAPAGPPLKALEAMTAKQLGAELDAAGATLVADGAKKVVFLYGRPGNGTDYLVARWRGLAETDPLRLEFDELARCDVAAAAADELPVDRLQRAPDPGLVNLPTIWPRMRFPFRVATSRCPETKAFQRPGMCYRVIRDAKRRSTNHQPRAEDDQCPAYYGVDYQEERGKLTCRFTVHEGTKTLAKKNAPADRRRSREALRSLENAFSEFMPVRGSSADPSSRSARPSQERFYGIDDRNCAKGKVLALASIPGARGGGNRDDAIVFGTYDSKVEVSIQEKHRISEVVVARIEEVNVARAGAEKPLPPLHVAGASRRLERYKADFALQLKDLAYVEAADEAYLRDQAAALAPPEPMPDGSRPPIDAHSRRAAAAAAAAAAAERATRRRPRRRRRGARGRAEAPAEAPAASPPTAPPVEAPAEAPAPAAAPAKKKKKRSRRRGPAPPAEISEYERTRMRNIAAGNKKLYSLGLIHPPPEVVADPEHSWWSERARTRVFSRSHLTTRALPQAQS
ncbi:hypothetical protein JL722_732 [Aureococcus anophagefferens]|nr:hypothetical protein JL722_732 [Aureococcus anophagefferens]